MKKSNAQMGACRRTKKYMNLVVAECGAERNSESALRDVLTDLRHYAASRDWNFDKVLLSSEEVFLEESE